MKHAAALLTLAVVLTAAPADAFDGPLRNLFNRKSKQKSEPPARVKQLVGTLQSDPDEGKRKSAAESLAEFDPRNAPDVIPGLIGALQKDPSPAVRSEVAGALGKIKPVSQPAGIALENALASDPDAKVREAIQSALWQYHLNGYRPAPSPGIAPQTGEPPLASRKGKAAPPGPLPTTNAFRPITTTTGKGVQIPQTGEPPLAKPKQPAQPAPAVLPAPLPAASVPDPSPTIPAPTPPPSVGVPPVSAPPLPTIPTPPSGQPVKQ